MTDFAWATVTAVDPIAVRLDGDALSVPFAPDSLVAVDTLAVGDRVRCELSERRLVIHGRSNGEDSRSFLLGMAYLWPGSSPLPPYLLPLEGQTIVGGVSSHSGLAVVHPEWVSGADLVLPDWRGRVPVGQLPGDSLFGIPGALVGSKTHTLTVAELPNLQGQLTPHGAEGGSGFWNPTGVFSSSPIYASGYKAPPSTTGGASSIGRLVYNNGGGGAAHNNVQPSVVARWCVMAATSGGEYSREVQQALVARVTELAQPPCFQVFRAETGPSVTLPTVAALVTGWGTPVVHRGVSWSSGVLTIEKAGIYHVVAQVGSVTGNGNLNLQVTLNSTVADSAATLATSHSATSASLNRTVGVDFYQRLVAGDKLRVYWADTAAGTVGAAARAMRFAAAFFSD